MVTDPAWQQLNVDCAADVAELIAGLLDLAGPASVSFPEAPAGRRRLHALFPAGRRLDGLARMLAATGDCHLRIETVADENWLAVSRAAWSPQDLGDGVWVGPGWCRPPAAARLYLRIDPGRAFGTGQHPTTRLCLRWLISHAGELPPLAIDYGCGSGVLAIAAARLGVQRVIATDSDPLSLATTADNAVHNGVSDRITVVPPTELTRSPVKLVLANILLRPLLALAPRLNALVTRGGRIVMSGILREQVDRCREQYQNAFDLEPPVVEDPWVLLVGQRRSTGAE